MTWTAPVVDRPDVDYAPGNERAALTKMLAVQRQTLLFKCSGLTADQLKVASVPPSSLTLLGLVRHMAEVERWWMRRSFGDAPDLHDPYSTDEFPDGDFDLVADADAAADLVTFAQEITLCDQAADARALDDSYVSKRGNTINQRWIYVHLIHEYARHNGHADLLRERIDGTTGL